MINTEVLFDKGLRDKSWSDWKWQQRHAIRSVEDLLTIFPNIPLHQVEAIRKNLKSRRFQITPYYLSLIRRNGDGQSPDPADPMWRMIVPYWESEGRESYSYDGHTENWELNHEMVTPIAQHKYDNRIIVRLSNVCYAYCQFCYEALRTIEKKSNKLMFQKQYWDATVEYVRQHREVEEVILSGGEPLMHDDTQLGEFLGDLRAVGRWVAIRIHTRALTFNPFRITDELTECLQKYEVNAIGVHVAHPNEITPEFRQAAKKIQGVVPIMFANIPLLRGINDNIETMHELGMKLYSVGIIPQYLYHFMPHSPGALEFRTRVQTGVDIIRGLKRRISNLAVPEFVLPHYTGKHTMPLLAEDEKPPYRTYDNHGNPVIRYSNWRGEIVDYLDAR
ncbi:MULTISPECIES: KamA family radical SAM protein [Alicyclobacillus]|uniref:L-lysine 2,3-aminomutase n=1 Tax=Alicyclobacillus vulcanalis TaxID=252246 RepID=A0A1N7PRQ8_9BACL|nr:MULTISPECIES: KamA family radical SAM protein [Alicyclobacillus]SIT13278.1 L-lysine 2,3-aminomutase [Alicyclobacillus vulcanalis]